MKLYWLLLSILLPNSSIADCDDALRKCKNECSTSITVEGIGIESYQTDFQYSCEDACKKGSNECEDTSGDLAEKCDEFKRKCNRSCPSSVHVYSNSRGIDSGYKFNTNANSICEDACRSGYRRCD